MTFIRTFSRAAAAGMACALLWSGAQAQDNTRAPVRLTIESQPLEDALNEFARQTGYQLLFQSDVVLKQTAPRVDGALTPESALKALLANSGLHYKFVNPRTVAISSTNESAALLTAPELKLAQAARQASGQSSASTASAQQNSESASGAADEKFQEIVVTAQKRSERLQDVPVPVAAISAERLVDANQFRLQDYYAKVPGLSFTSGNRGEPSLAIRGISTNMYLNPTVGIVVDDVPYGASTAIGGGFSVPDIDPSELSRVEVLRGPQGTLYGASSIGGLLKFVTIDPSTEGFSGRVQAGMSSVRNGDELGYSVRGAVNVPLSETWALRASAFTRRDPGYIDDPGLGQEGVNWAEVNGGRLSALWRPSDDFSLKLSALLQDAKRHGKAETHLLPGLPDLQQAYEVPGAGLYNKKINAYQAIAAVRFGRVDLTSVTGYSTNEAFNRGDFTAFLGGLSQSLFGQRGTPLDERNKTNKFSQEIRLTGPLGSRAEWLVGGFYTRERSSVVSELLAVSTTSGAVAGRWFDNTYPTRYREYAAFANLTFHITERFDLQVGGRQSRNEQSYTQTVVGPYNTLIGSPDPNIVPLIDSDDSSFTYLVTPQLKISPNMMAYMRLASGYRPGGPNQNNPVLGLPPSYEPDTTENYELGLKGSMLDRALSYDVSLYYIDWSDIQISLVDANFQGYNDNGSRAKSQGVELSLESRPLDGLTITAWAVWNAAELKESFPTTSSAFGVAGDRLPYSSRFSGNLSIEDEFPLASSMSGFVGASLAYIGDRRGSFGVGSPVRQEFPAYAQVDAHAGIRRDTWTFNLTVNNLTDRRGILSGGIGAFPAYAFTYIQPRTIGLSLSKTF